MSTETWNDTCQSAPRVDVYMTLCICLNTGADITDYFNYGFTEETWKMYCDKQRKMKTEVGNLNKIAVSLQATVQSKYCSPSAVPFLHSTRHLLSVAMLYMYMYVYWHTGYMYGRNNNVMCISHVKFVACEKNCAMVCMYLVLKV